MSREKQTPVSIRSSAAGVLTYVASTGDPQGSIEIRYEDETIWLTQKTMAQLYDISVPTVNEHIKKIFADSELQESSVIRKFRITASDGKSYSTNHYALQKQGELDFLVAQADTVLPIEIKAGKDYTKHAALNHVLANPDYAIPEAYVFHNGNVSTAGKITYLPIYMLMFVEKKKLEGDLIYKLDLSALQGEGCPT